MNESIVWIESESSLFGILTEPAAPVSNRPTILLPNAGSAHHVGPNRLYLLLSRALARAGFRCLRFDLPGLGDSVIGDAERENDPYPASATAVLRDVMETMRGHHGAGSFVVAGLCSGAHTAFHAALAIPDAPIVESMLINPLTFYYEPGMSLDQPQAAEHVDVKHVEAWQWYMRSLRSRAGWKKLLRLNVRVDRIAWAVFHRAAGAAGQRLAAIRDAMRRDHERPSSQLERDVCRIVEMGRRITFIFASFDPGIDLLMSGAGPAVKRLRKNGQLRLWVVDGADHTFEAGRGRAAMFDSVVRHLSERYAR